MAIDYSTPRYSIRDAAAASGFELNTLRSLYGRGHFRIIGGDDKKGRGLAAELTLSDLMCIAAAKVAIDAGVHPRIAFDAGMTFAYSSGGATGPNTGTRLPSHLFETGHTVLVCYPAAGTSKVANYGGDARDLSILDDFDALDPIAPVLVPLNGLHARVLNALGIEPEAA